MADYSDEPDDSDDLREYKRKQREWIDKSFQLPGDYRAERLYAKFADARWGNFKFVGKTFMIDGVARDYPVWKLASLKNARVANAFENVFKDIWVERQMAGLTTIGTRFNLDNPAETTSRPATYREFIYPTRPFS